jgi:tRNA (cytidine/uridine-2'-O-)-methyltransferase
MTRLCFPFQVGGPDLHAWTMLPGSPDFEKVAPPPAALDGTCANWYSGGVNAAPTLHIVLHRPEIPQNTGNIGRTCVAIHAKLWLVRPLGFQMDQKQVRRAGLDYWPHLEWEVVDRWEDVAARIADFRPWFFSKSARRRYTDVQYARGDALVFGAETTGLPRSLLEAYPDRVVRIPIGPQVRSLNLSNAVAVAAYEALRQRRFEDLAPEPPR